MAVRHGERWVVYLSGELDLASRRQLLSMAEILACRDGKVDFDLSGLGFIDSSGWTAVQDAARTARGRIVNPSAPVKRVTELMARTGTLRRHLPTAA